ncbi:hypothetical protein VIBNISFn118_1090036 [Vibrio nigripulchritudo SFn118]|nr:hypothetical protein VIBNISFn118_1090036 [Vibrio nigripulchritudo SFn118]
MRINLLKFHIFTLIFKLLAANFPIHFINAPNEYYMNIHLYKLSKLRGNPLVSLNSCNNS